ncbi:hypothetical protein CDD82_5135 [Ophiocordyceps australis]|uniref:DNA-directed RNA polymerase RBP11-like dimerisation domain-containing protein n=1 Tax=Ophiocordyceps australis TaxID=1399860 RepID=A0A2C5ZL13_9HYPO|nr:hypothetical protein CDD82_5135 [Ophiocordyceps australis]
MQDAPLPDPSEVADGIVENEVASEDDEPEVQQIRLLPGSTDSAASFEFADEGHTLGNALRYIITKNSNVEFCAYAIPHPSEPKMNLRIQTWEGTAIDALEKGLADLQDMCDVVTDKFQTARNTFKAEKSPTE